MTRRSWALFLLPREHIKNLSFSLEIFLLYRQLPAKLNDPKLWVFCLKTLQFREDKFWFLYLISCTVLQNRGVRSEFHTNTTLTLHNFSTLHFLNELLRIGLVADFANGPDFINKMSLPLNFNKLHLISSTQYPPLPFKN